MPLKSLSLKAVCTLVCGTMFLIYPVSPLFAEPEKIDLGNIKHVRHAQAYLAQRENYFIDLLTLALEKSGASYKLHPIHAEPHSEYRGALYLKNGEFDVHWLNTSEYLEQQLIPIRIPLFRGMIGWRLLIIRSEDAGKFAQVQTVEELRQYIALQGGSWPDTQILRNSGFRVETATDLFSLQHMLRKHHGDFFPRGITEAWSEINSYAEFNFAVDTHLVLHYPAAYYFFVRKDQLVLAQALEKGLKLAIEDGSFDRIFWPYFEDDIRKTRLNSRVILSIPNPVLPAATPLEDKRLWFSIDELAHRLEAVIPNP